MSITLIFQILKFVKKNYRLIIEGSLVVLIIILVIVYKAQLRSKDKTISKLEEENKDLFISNNYLNRNIELIKIDKDIEIKYINNSNLINNSTLNKYELDKDSKYILNKIHKDFLDSYVK